MRKRRTGHASGPLLRLHLWLTYFFLFLPIVVLAVLSFNRSHAIGLPMRGLTFDWYLSILGNSAILDSFLSSLQLGLVVAVVSTLIGTLAALSVRSGLMMQNWFMQLLLLPLVTPGIVGGIALFMCLAYLGIPRSLFGSMLIGHVSFTVPYIFLIVSARLSGMDKSLEQAAADLGANAFQVFILVTYPLIRPAVLGGGLLVFLLSFDEFIRTLFLIGIDQTLPLAIWGLMFDALTPEIPALMTMLLIFNVVLLVTGQWLLRRKVGG